MELQKQPMLATKEQLRLAELTQTANEVGNTHDDITLQKRVKKVMELTRCNYSQAEVALMDSENNVEAAVSLLLDTPEELVLWSQQGKTRKVKPTSVEIKAKANYGSQGRSQKGNRNRREAGEQQTGMDAKQSSNQSARIMRSTQNNEHNGAPTKGRAFKNRGTSGPGAFRRDRGPKNEDLVGKRETVERTGWSDGYNGWSAGESRSGENQWSESVGWADEKKSGGDGGFSTIGSAGNDKDDEWKNGPRVFMPSSLSSAVVAETTKKSTSVTNWPALDAVATSNAAEVAPQQMQEKPKTFASVAAAKKVAPPPPPQAAVAKPQTVTNQPAEVSTSAESTANGVPAQPQKSSVDMKNSESMAGEQWSTSVDWGSSVSPSLSTNEQPQQPSSFGKQSAAAEPVPSQSGAAATSANVFAASTHSMHVNQEYTDQLKNAIGLVSSPSNGHVQQPQQVMGVQPSSSTSSCSAAAVNNYMHHLQSVAIAELNNSQEKVEFMTGDIVPPISTSYQFGYHFDSKEAWGQQQPVSSIELDRSVLKNSTGSVLSTISIPTTSSTMSAHFSTSTQQRQLIEQQQRNTNGSAGRNNNAALSFTGAESVNFPPSNESTQQQQLSSATAATGLAQQPQQANMPPTTGQAMQQSKPLYTNPSVATTAPPQQMQHLQQPHQNVYHQTSAAGMPPQFPNYNLPYMYSPVAAAPTLAGTSDIDRFLLQQYGPYSEMGMQMSQMSLGPPNTLATNHRTTIDTYLENKFSAQQQSVNQGGNSGGYQQQQSNQQQRQPESGTMLSGGGPVAPPPGFGMPAAPAQPSYMPQANLQSLFQMPTYHPYQQHHFMMPNANRLPQSQRPAQTSPPEGNGPPQRRGNDPQQGGFGGTGGGGDSAGDHSTGNAPQAYGNNYNKYRPYM